MKDHDFSKVPWMGYRFTCEYCSFATTLNNTADWTPEWCSGGVLRAITIVCPVCRRASIRRQWCAGMVDADKPLPMRVAMVEPPEKWSDTPIPTPGG